MSRSKGSLFAVAAISLFFATGPARGQVLHGVTFNAPGQLLTINPTTGVGTLVAPVPASNLLADLAYRGTRLYTWNQSTSRMMELDPVTAAVLNNIDIGVVSGAEGGLSFRSDGIGFLSFSLGGVGDFYRFDITVPSSAPITAPGGLVPSMDGLAFSAADVLYGISQGGAALYTVNQTSGATTLVGNTGIPTGAIALGGLTFGPGGTLYAVLANPSQLFRIDTTTGAGTLIGNVGVSDVTGIAFPGGALTPPGPTGSEGSFPGSSGPSGPEGSFGNHGGLVVPARTVPVLWGPLLQSPGHGRVFNVSHRQQAPADGRKATLSAQEESPLAWAMLAALALGMAYWLSTFSRRRPTADHGESPGRARKDILVHIFVGSLVMTCLISVAADVERSGAEAQHDWPQWRGPLGTGVAPGAQPPVTWSETKHIRWKTLLPGKGHSTPIVWGEHIFLTTAIPYGEAVKPRIPSRPGAHDNLALTHHHEYVVLAVSRQSGKILWQQSVHKELPHEAGHVTASLASASPVTDGAHVFASFGSRGLFCLDTGGKLLWKKNLGEMHTKHGHGEGSSPALHGETLIVNWDHEEQSFVVALDKRTGKLRWRAARAEDTSWATPIIVEHGGSAQVIVPGTNRLRGYDLASGAVIWECGGLSSNIVASPVAAHGVVYAGSSYDTRALLAIRLDGAKGDITGTKQVLWFRRRGTPYVPSPLLYGDTLYTLQHYQGVMSRLDVKTGDDQGGPFRLEAIDNVYASPVAAAGRIYVTSRDGVTQVMSHGEPTPKMLAVNRLDDSISASAALAGRELFLRGERYLYCIAEE